MGPRILDIRSVDSQVVSVLLDTSILIYYLEGVEPYYPLTEEIFNDIADENIRGSLSAISITEFVTKPLADGKVIVVEYFKQFLSALSIQVLAVTYAGAFSFKQILGLSKFLDPLFQVRRGSKPRLPGLGGPKSG